MKDDMERQQQSPEAPTAATGKPMSQWNVQALPHGNGATPRLAYRVNETAQMLGISEKSVRRLIARGLLRTSRALRHLLIPRSEIERFLNETL